MLIIFINSNNQSSLFVFFNSVIAATTAICNVKKTIIAI
jgi:hypothetical protein